MSSLTLEPILGSTWLTLLVILFTGIVLLLVRPDGSRLSRTRMQCLISLRLGALFLILLAMLRPSLITMDNRPTPASLVVLADDSRSMTLTDGEGRTRWETQRRILQRLAPALSNLDKDLEVSVYKYGENVTPVPLSELDTFLQTEPSQRQTDLARPLKAALAGTSGRPLAGIVLLGDGTSTIPDSNPATVVRNLAALDVPLWTVPIGPPAGDSQSRDVAVEQLAETFRVFSKNLFRVSAAIEAKGMVGRDVAVSIALVKNDGTEAELAKRVLVPGNPTETLPLDVELLAPEPGSYRLEVRAETQQGETVTANNSQVAFLDVREGGGRIFYLEGQPRLEQLFLRRSLDEASDFLMTLQLAPKAESKWPINLGNAFKPGLYDVVILGDIPAAALGNENLEKLVAAVENGAGLLMIGGQRTFDLGGYASSPLARILPIKLQSVNNRNQSNVATNGLSLEEPIELKIRKPHPITRLGNASATENVWNDLRPLLGANRFAEVKQDPTVEVLLESSSGNPMLVVGSYGTGRIAAFAGDTTWQWWRQGEGETHRRFWRQIVLWLLARDGPETDSIWIRLDNRRFQRETPSGFTVGVQSLGDSVDAKLQAEVVAADGTSKAVPLIEESGRDRTVPEAPLASGVIPELPGGIYKLRVYKVGQDNISPSNGANASLKDSEILFQVIDVDAELSRPTAEVARLQQLSALTKDAGGQSYRPDNVGTLLELITDLRTRSSLPVVERLRLGEGPISGWILLVTFSSLLCCEWYLRKRWGLA